MNEMYPNLQKFSDLTMVVPPYELTDIMCGKWYFCGEFLKD